MIIVKIELHSAIDGTVKEIGRMNVWNDGTGNANTGNYKVGVHRRNRQTKFDNFQRQGEVKNFPRASYNVWRLISRAILAAFPEEAKNG